jgi:branched-chain amino acid transport system substrate-binding protein
MKALSRFALIVVILFGLIGCGHKESILVGLAVELTGRQAEIGINIRDAALMAVDEVNAQGGINGRPVELVVRDDQGNSEVARQVDAELVSMGAVAIIGHYTSAQTAAVIDQMNTAQVVLISPSAASSAFSGQADYLFRLTSDTDFIGTKLGEHLAGGNNNSPLIGIYDENNLSFSKAFWDAVQESFTAAGGSTESLPFNSTQADLQQVAAQVKEKQPGAVVIVASAVDTAVLVQYLRQTGVAVPLFASPWAHTSQLIEKGGQAVDGLVLSSFYDINNPRPEHLQFVQAFEKRFGRTPQLGTTQAYEAVMVLAEALRATNGGRAGLREALLALRDFPGILGPITFDSNGDVSRDIYIMRVEGGRIVEQEVISP